MEKKLVKVWTKPDDDIYVYWEYDDGETGGAYNMLYETENGLRTLKEIMELELTESS